jgi:hypothetical protein
VTGHVSVDLPHHMMPPLCCRQTEGRAFTPTPVPPRVPLSQAQAQAVVLHSPLTTAARLPASVLGLLPGHRSIICH